MKIKKILFSVFCAGFVVCIILFPKECLSSASQAIDSWFTIVLPSLLPFFMANALLSQTGILRVVSAVFEPFTKRAFHCSGYFAYVFIASAFSGYPMGAKLSADLYHSGLLSSEDAHFILRSTSISGPAFISGAVCTGMLGMEHLAFYLLLPHFLCALLIAAILSVKNRKTPLVPSPGFLKQFSLFIHDNPLYYKNIGSVLAEAVVSSLQSILQIGGFMILFTVLLKILETIGVLSIITYVLSPLFSICGLSSSASYSLIAGAFEMTTGCLYTAQSTLPLTVQLIFMNAIISFSGLSILAQSVSIASSAKISCKGFIGTKILQALLCSVTTAGLLWLAPPASQVFSPASSPASFEETWFTGFGLFLLAVGCSLFSYFAIQKRQRRKDKKATFFRK